MNLTTAKPPPGPAAIVLLALTLLFSHPCDAQPANPEVEASRPTEPVILNGTVLFRVRGAASYPARERAQAITNRIESVAADLSLPVTELRLGDTGEWATISAGDHPLMAVTDADANLEGTNRKILAEVLRLRISQALTTYRHDRSPGVLFSATLYAAGATVAMLLTLFVAVRLFRRLYAAAERRFRTRMGNVRSSALHVLKTDRLWTALSKVLRVLRALLILVIGFFYTDFVLSLYPWTRETSRNLLAILLSPLKTMGKATVESLPSLLFLAILVIVVRYALSVIRMFFEAIEDRTITIHGFDREWAIPTYQIARGLVIAFGLVVAYPYLPGSESAAFKGVSVFLGLVFSLSSSSAIANVIAGYTLVYRRAYVVGDRVKIGEAIGDVAEIRLQATYLHSLKNEVIIVPNSEILKASVVNFSAMAKQPGLILHTTVGIGYETPWRQVEAMLLEAAQRTPGLLREPPPFVWQKSLGDFAITYEINAYTDQPNASGLLYTALHRNILDIFNEYGVQIMTPAYVADPKEPKVVPRDQQFGRSAEASD